MSEFTFAFVDGNYVEFYLMGKDANLISRIKRNPFYIVHQTITVITAYYIYDLHWSVTSKFFFLTVTVVIFGGSWIIFEGVKQFAPTRLLFGIKQRK